LDGLVRPIAGWGLPPVLYEPSRANWLDIQPCSNPRNEIFSNFRENVLTGFASWNIDLLVLPMFCLDEQAP